MARTPISRRQRQILDLLRASGEVTVQGVASEFGVTPVTVRRDLDHLDRMGLVHRTHGGALPSRPAGVEFPFGLGPVANLREKASIGCEAARLLRPGMKVVLDTGTTTREVARAIAGCPSLTVLTSSLAVAAELFAREGIELVLLGGTVRRTQPDLTGPMTEDNLRHLRVDWAILGADALDTEGLYTPDLSVARLSRSMISGARKVMVVADSSKFKRSSFVRFADWSQVDVLVTDEAIPAEALEWVRGSVKELHLAAVGRSTRHP